MVLSLSLSLSLSLFHTPWMFNNFFSDWPPNALAKIIILGVLESKNIHCQDSFIFTPFPDVIFMARQHHGFSMILPQFGTPMDHPQALSYLLLWLESSL